MSKKLSREDRKIVSAFFVGSISTIRTMKAMQMGDTSDEIAVETADLLDSLQKFNDHFDLDIEPCDIDFVLDVMSLTGIARREGTRGGGHGK